MLIYMLFLDVPGVGDMRLKSQYSSYIAKNNAKH